MRIALQQQRGFTLIELLVAMLVFSLLAMAGYRGLQSILETRDHLDQETRKFQEMAQFFSRLQGQLAQASLHPARLVDGRMQSALTGVSSDQSNTLEGQLLFTRGGGKDATGSWVTPQRVGYRLRNHAIELMRWDYLVLAPASKPRVDTVLKGVREFNLRFLSPQTLAWEKQYAVQVVNLPLPKALEVELILLSGEKVVRVFDLP